MTLQLLSPDEYNLLLSIQQEYPKLTFQNNGYEYIDKKSFSEEDAQKFAEVTEILKNHIEGFVKFNNFLYDKQNELNVRFQYKWDTSFTGVGYLKVRELLNGFDELDKTIL